MAKDKFEILGVPAHVEPFDSDLKWSHGVVDYPNHPAYQSLANESSMVLRAKAMLQFIRSMVPLMIKRLIRYEMIPLEVRSPKSSKEVMTLLGVAGRNALGWHAKAPDTASRSNVFKTLDRDGCCVVHINDDRYAPLKLSAKEFFDNLRERRAKSKSNERGFEESRSSVDSRQDGDDLFQILNDILNDSGIIDSASQYLGRQARLIDVNPQINDSSDSFWRNIFPDLESMDLPKSAYFHRDASGGDLKAIFYMSDVGPQNGPFSYVVGSNQMKISRMNDLIAEANDHNGLSATNPTARTRFAALPAKLRQKGSFGNDLIDSDKMAVEIEKGTWQIVAPEGSIVLFDTKGVHRGGMVVEGERHVITTVIG